MKRLLALLTFTPLLLLAEEPAAVTDATANGADAHRAALELAGAFSNDGFKLRDGTWSGSVQPGKPQLVQVNLYAGNEYWFSVGATAQAQKLAVTVYDESGTPMESEPHAEGPTAAAGFSPDASGPYFVRIESLEGEPATFCLIYSYK
jgi:hypothetical protein